MSDDYGGSLGSWGCWFRYIFGMRVGNECQLKPGKVYDCIYWSIAHGHTGRWHQPGFINERRTLVNGVMQSADMETPVEMQFIQEQPAERSHLHNRVFRVINSSYCIEDSDDLKPVCLYNVNEKTINIHEPVNSWLSPGQIGKDHTMGYLIQYSQPRADVPVPSAVVSVPSAGVPSQRADDHDPSADVPAPSANDHVSNVIETAKDIAMQSMIEFNNNKYQRHDRIHGRVDPGADDIESIIIMAGSDGKAYMQLTEQTTHYSINKAKLEIRANHEPRLIHGDEIQYPYPVRLSPEKNLSA